MATKVVSLDRSQVLQVLNVLRDKSPVSYCIGLLALVGVRPQEIARLEVSDFDEAAKLLHVTQPGKKSTRTVKMDDTLVSALKARICGLESGLIFGPRPMATVVRASMEVKTVALLLGFEIQGLLVIAKAYRQIQTEPEKPLLSGWIYPNYRLRGWF